MGLWFRVSGSGSSVWDADLSKTFDGLRVEIMARGSKAAGSGLQAYGDGEPLW